jgi:hypothetical protein
MVHPVIDEEGEMARIVRYGLIVVGLAQLAAALVFFFQWPLVSLWPYPGTTPLTYIFISSIFAAAAAPTLWAAITDNLGALAGIGLDYLTILGPLSVYSLVVGAGSGDVRMIAFALSCAAGALFGLGMLLWSAGIPTDRTTRMPGVVKWSFITFAVLLVIVAARMILQVPTSVPWSVTPQLRVVMGFMFLGAAMYFVYGLLRPSWLNAAGQYIGFLAYDLVLIPPFLAKLPTTAPQFKFGMSVYTGVVIGSALLGVFFLFVYSVTRKATWTRSRRSEVIIARPR